MKKNKVLLLIIVINIIIITILVIKYYKYTKQKTDQTTYKISYKHFEFDIPQNVTFSEDDKYTFVLETSDWKAYVEIIHDNEKRLINDAEMYYNSLKKNYKSYNLGQVKKEMINNKMFNICTRYGNSNNIVGAIGITDFHGNFIYQIDFIALNNNFSKSAMKPVIEIMNNSKYKNDSDEIYYYRPASYIVKG